MRLFFMFLLPLSAFIGIFLGLTVGGAALEQRVLFLLLMLACWALVGGFMAFAQTSRRQQPLYR